MPECFTEIRFEKWPFFVGPLSDERNSSLPYSGEFHLSVCKDLAFPRLRLNEALLIALDGAYRNGSSCSTPLGTSALSQVRMDEFMTHLRSQVVNFGNRINFVVEIGCGSGELLNQIRQEGYKILGFEPGPAVFSALQKFGTHFINSKFDPLLLPQPPDLIVAAGVLEHIVDIERFLEEVYNNLNDEGLFFVSVPNTDQYFKTSNLDSLSFEHVNYFCKRNLELLFECYGFEGIGCAISESQNELFAWGKKNKNIEKRSPASINGVLELETKYFGEQAKLINFYAERLKPAIEKRIANGDGLCFCSGGFNAAAMTRDSSGIRFWDGDEAKWNKRWLSNLRTIESTAQLQVDPPDVCVIFAEHHYEKIASKLWSALGSKSRIEIIPATAL